MGVCFLFFCFPDDWRLGRSESWDGLEFVQRIGWQVGDVLIFILLCWLYNKFAWFCWQISMKYCHCDRLHVFLLNVLNHDARKGMCSILRPEKSIIQCVHFQVYNRKWCCVLASRAGWHTTPLFGDHFVYHSFRTLEPYVIKMVISLISWLLYPYNGVGGT